MQKQVPTVGKLLIMVFFALSCFGLLLFLWLSFGGTVPLKPKGYRVKMGFPEATQLGLYADVRTAGVTVGKVVQKQLDPSTNRTIATVQLDPRFAPLRSDARAILRQKTLLGETYVELTPGTKRAPFVPENGRLANVRVAPTTELDEIFQAFDPQTRRAFQGWQNELAQAITGRGGDLNDAIGNLPTFSASATDVLNVLNAQSDAVRALFRNAGVVFNALSRNQAALHGLIVNGGKVFDATAAQQRALAQTFAIFPTFLDESRFTASRLQSFALDTDPLIQELRPVARDLRPTLHDLRGFAPDLESTFRKLQPLIQASRTGLPALSQTLRGLKPLLGKVQPFLEQLNPILQFLEIYQYQTGDFITNAAGAVGDTIPQANPLEIGHYLRQTGPTGPESVAMYPNRLPTFRGNAYLPPLADGGPLRAKYNIFPSWDCNNVGGPTPPVTEANEADPTYMNGPSCWTEAMPLTSKPGQFPHVGAADYSK